MFYSEFVWRYTIPAITLLSGGIIIGKVWGYGYVATYLLIVTLIVRMAETGK